MSHPADDEVAQAAARSALARRELAEDVSRRVDTAKKLSARTRDRYEDARAAHDHAIEAQEAIRERNGTGD